MRLPEVADPKHSAPRLLLRLVPKNRCSSPYFRPNHGWNPNQWIKVFHQIVQSPTVPIYCSFLCHSVLGSLVVPSHPLLAEVQLPVLVP